MVQKHFETEKPVKIKTLKPALYDWQAIDDFFCNCNDADKIEFENKLLGMVPRYAE